METHISPLYLDPERGASILESFRAIEYKHLDALEKGMAHFPRYNLDFAQQILERETRLYLARNNEPQVITDDPHRRTDEGFHQAFAKWAGIHRNWPAVLLKPHEFEPWKAYYFAEIDICNQAGFYLAEVLQWNYNMNTVQRALAERVNTFTLFDEVNVSMLIKYRWYKFTMSRFHKQDRLDQVEAEFRNALQGIPQPNPFSQSNPS